MPRLFPGIDPYLEAQGLWSDFHARTITYCCDAIADELPDSYLVRMEERISLVELAPGEASFRRPDLTIERSSTFSTPERGSLILEMEPTTVRFPLVEEVREVYIEIHRRRDQHLVAVVELLSPDNKSGKGAIQYLAKRDALLCGSVHLIELDLLIGGHRLPMADPLPPGDAYALVARAHRYPNCEVYAWSIRQRLSKIRIPLLAPDPDIALDLGAIYDLAFEKGRYARTIEYDAPLTIALAPEDRAWAETLARGSDR